MKLRSFLVLVFALMAAGPLLYSQGTARVVGVVTDSGGGLVPGAQVTLINDATGLRETAPTDEGGRYNFTQLAVGNYRIEISAGGFKKETRITPITHPRNWGNVAPRFGFAWLPFGPDSKTSIRGAYGIFYNTERDYLENETQIVQPFVLNLNVVENKNPQGFVNPWAVFPGGDPFPYTAPTSAAGRAAIQFVLPAQIQRFFGPDWHTPYNQQWNLSIQRQIPWSTVVSAAYVGSKATHLVLNA